MCLQTVFPYAFDVGPLFQPVPARLMVRWVGIFFEALKAVHWTPNSTKNRGRYVHFQ